MEEQESRPTQSQAEPELLYHYTNEAGLNGILNSGNLWATHYRFLNDTTERQTALNLYRSTLASALAQEFGSSPACARAWIDYLQGFFDMTEAYVASFSVQLPSDSSPAYDRLSQWRGYAFGVQGYCLAFAKSRLPQMQESIRDHKCLGHSKCWYIYEDDARASAPNATTTSKVIGIINEYTTGLFAKFLNAPRLLQASSPNEIRSLLNLNDNARSDVFNYIIDALCLCVMLKHPGFSEESEYRIIWHDYHGTSASDPQMIQFRPGPSGPIPYVALSLSLKEENPLLEWIIVGPSTNNEQVAANLRIRLQKMRLSGVQVETSKIPYRNW